MIRRVTARVTQLGKVHCIENFNGAGAWKPGHSPVSAGRLKKSVHRSNEVDKRGLS